MRTRRILLTASRILAVLLAPLYTPTQAQQCGPCGYTYEEYEYSVQGGEDYYCTYTYKVIESFYCGYYVGSNAYLLYKNCDDE
jgi:hypothetical protein